MWNNRNERNKTTKHYGDEIMKFIIFLFLLIPIISILHFVLTDLIDDLVSSQKKQRKARPVSVSNDTYEYQKAQ